MVFLPSIFLLSFLFLYSLARKLHPVIYRTIVAIFCDSYLYGQALHCAVLHIISVRYFALVPPCSFALVDSPGDKYLANSC
ncbi:MAG TPA: hypothetical protein DIW64_19070 [Cellvibrio sp.]|nr:hypothetical protein [Cellvibrio sp.]